MWAYDAVCTCQRSVRHYWWRCVRGPASGDGVGGGDATISTGVRDTGVVGLVEHRTNVTSIARQGVSVPDHQVVRR